MRASLPSLLLLATRGESVLSSRKIQGAVGVAVSLVLLWLFVRRADLAQVLEIVRAARAGYVAAAVGLVLVNQLQRAARWGLILRPVARVRFWPRLESTLIGWSVTTLLPGRLGELVRPVLLSRRERLSASATIASVVLERAFDALAVLLLLAAYLAFLPPPPALDQEGRAVLGALHGAGLVALAVTIAGGLLLAVGLRSDAVRRAADAWTRRLLPDRVAQVARRFVDGLAGLRSPLLVGRILLSSLLLWLTIAATYALLFRAFRLALPVAAAIPVVAILVLGVMVPTPGAIGSFHKAAQVALVSLWRVDNDTAVAYAIVGHAVAFLPHALIGLLLLARAGLTLEAARRIGSEAGAMDDAGTGI